MEHYVIEYDHYIHEDDDVVVQYTTYLPNTKEIKLFLKKAFDRADEIEYRFGGSTKKRKARATAQSIPAIPAVEGGTILFSGILNENVNADPTLDELATSNEDGEECNSESDDRSNCDIKSSAFAIDGGVDEDVYISKVDDTEEDVDSIGDGWFWNKWEEIGEDEEIPGPKKNDHYNRRHGLKEGIGAKLSTILQFIFETTCMNRDFSKDLLHSQARMREQIWCAGAQRFIWDINGKYDS